MFIKPRFPDVINYHTLDVEDREDQNLIRIYSSARDFIDQEIAKGGKVLIHDDGGISRAPAFAVMSVHPRSSSRADRRLAFLILTLPLLQLSYHFDYYQVYNGKEDVLLRTGYALVSRNSFVNDSRSNVHGF